MPATESRYPFFHDFDENGKVLHQAHVLSKTVSGKYRVQYYDWSFGEAGIIVTRDLPKDGVFYKTAMDMRLGYRQLILQGKTNCPEEKREERARDCEFQERMPVRMTSHGYAIEKW